jgi:hypothetical protein
MNVPYRGSQRFYEPKTMLATVKVKCIIHDSPYIYKATGNCIQGMLKKQVCKLEGGSNGGI